MDYRKFELEKGKRKRCHKEGTTKKRYWNSFLQLKSRIFQRCMYLNAGKNSIDRNMNFLPGWIVKNTEPKKKSGENLG